MKAHRGMPGVNHVELDDRQCDEMTTRAIGRRVVKEGCSDDIATYLGTYLSTRHLLRYLLIRYLLQPMISQAKGFLSHSQFEIYAPQKLESD